MNESFIGVGEGRGITKHDSHVVCRGDIPVANILIER